MRNTKQVHTSTSRRYLKRRKPRDRSSETERGGVLCCDSTGKWGLEAIGEGGIFRRTPAAGVLSMGQTTGCKAGRPVLVAAKHVGFSILAIHDTFVSSSAHGHGRPAYHRSVPVHDREPNAPGYPMGTRTRQSKSTNAAPYPTSPHHSGVRQPSSCPGPIPGISSPYRALTASVFPNILLKISQILHAGLMYHIDCLTGHKSCHERR